MPASDPTPVKRVMLFFGYEKASQFMTDWKLMSDQDKKQITAGILDGTLTY